ncbi:3-oxo-tetronate kinase [uncultured Roseibium sp.]|uniref:3-oxo-tetronate kinase n=1 Tax=uncultured Roseibium sp. TaxID=1936171 RepID=UPI00261F9D54|nr:3-oxo-tetronate kinase [uncultured Roseibium sp.]
MLIGAIADDFTGASDIANTLSKGIAPEGGLRTAQYCGVPSKSANSGIQAGVIALKSRTSPVDEAVSESLAALQWLQSQGCSQIIFKYCSTFDSTPAGNIGPVAEALALALDETNVIVCPAFPGAGRTVYQGHLFVHDTLLSESGMQHHPLTPMTDPDIRRWLQNQTTWRVSHLSLAQQRTGRFTPSDVSADTQATERSFLVADAISDNDLIALGTASEGAKLLTGGSGIAMGLPRNFFKNGAPEPAKSASSPNMGDGAILAGSCSGATRQQIEAHSKNHPVFGIDAPSVLDGSLDSEALIQFFKRHRKDAPLVFSSGTPEAVAQIQNDYGSTRVAEALEQLFAETARKLVDAGFTRIVVAGGETSGAVAKAVCHHGSEEAMRIGIEIDPGVPILHLETSLPICLALKSGNFGARDFFKKALDMMKVAA